jgi:ABC-type uncharacterized transport system involved in gliding motility auxiliary subunit
MMSRTTAVIGSVLLLLVAFVAVNMIAGFGLRGARLDATAGGLYTLTKGSKNIARLPEEPISITFYYSAKLAANNASINTYATRVREMLEEYARLSGGKINLEVVDPEPFSEAEDRAQAAGIAAVPFSAGGENLYFGLAGSNSADGREIIPFFNPADERLLEYNISKFVYALANPIKPTIGVLSTLDIEGGFSMDPQTRQPRRTPPWRIAAELKETFNVTQIARDAAEIPANISVLIVIHPKDLSDATLYAIDQFIVRGGRAILCVDPNCAVDPEGGNPMTGGSGNNVSDLSKILSAWGVEVVPGKFVADIDLGLQIQQGGQQQQLLQVLGMTPKDVSKDDPITASIARLNMGTVGAIKALENVEPTKRITITPVIQSGERASLTDVAALMVPDPKALVRNYKPGSERLTLAARLTGTVPSAFASGPPTVATQDAAAAEKAKAAHIAQSTAPVNVLLFADVDFLNNMFWVRESEMLPGLPMLQKFADNGDMFLSAVDNMGGSSDLLAVRARQESARPFTVVEEMQKRANERYQKEEQLLEKELEQTQNRINELQGQKQGSDKFVLTAEQQDEVEKFQKQATDTRRKLREVKSNLRKDIESLGAQLKFINIGLIPILVTIGALGLGYYRISSRKVRVQTDKAT